MISDFFEPLDNELYIEASCGHECYEGDEVYEWENGKTLCAECMAEKFDELTLHEKAELLNCKHCVVSKDEAIEWRF